MKVVFLNVSFLHSVLMKDTEKIRMTFLLLSSLEREAEVVFHTLCISYLLVMKWKKTFY